MKKYETIEEFYKAVKSGDIDETKLVIVLDNDCTNFYLGPNEIVIKEANGYDDIEPLYALLFPEATVDWC